MPEGDEHRLEMEKLDYSELDCVGGGFQATEHGALSSDSGTTKGGGTYGRGWCYWHPYRC
jgi:hypothetical protein